VTPCAFPGFCGKGENPNPNVVALPEALRHELSGTNNDIEPDDSAGTGAAGAVISCKWVALK
jgi:hypothetical protein